MQKVDGLQGGRGLLEIRNSSPERQMLCGWFRVELF
jgi:hypothetical protein